MTDPDIVTRLRVLTDTLLLGDFQGLAATTASAADEIERLRNTRDALEAERDELIRISNKLKRDRDEARREVCMIMGGKGGRSSYISPDAVDYANSRGWDCFEEGNQ